MGDSIERAAAAVRRRTKLRPRWGIILGTGLGALAAKIRGAVRIPYAKIPGMPRTTVESHRGELVMGTIGGAPVVAMEGRFHYYEGHPIAALAWPVRLLRRLGAEVLVVSGACGAVNLRYRRGDIVVLDDHVNLMGVNPLVGPNDERVGPRFPDMAAPYDADLQRRAMAIARRRRIRAHRGVYVGVAGPNLETRAEYRMLRRLGADVVGMSVVAETVAAVHCGLRVFGAAIVTDLCDPDHLEPADIASIIAVANAAEPRLTALVTDLISTTP